MWSFLWQIVPDATAEDPGCILARELWTGGCRVRVRGAIGIALKRDRRDGDGWAFGQLPFQVVVLRFAGGQPNPPAVVVDYDGDVVRVVEGRCGAIKCRIIEVPLWRSGLPNELGKVVPVVFIPNVTAFRGEVVLVPPDELCHGTRS